MIAYIVFKNNKYSEPNTEAVFLSEELAYKFTEVKNNSSDVSGKYYVEEHEIKEELL